MGGFDEGSFAAVWCWVGFVWFWLEAVGRELFHRCLDLIDLPADVMEPFAMLVEVFRERVIWPQRLDELEAQVAHVEVGEAHADLVEDLAEEFGQPHLVAVELECVLGVADDDGDVVDFLEHAAS